ncbi:MAG TPA: sugar ABC transporter permease [Anaerolineales bacterium]|nr:sugar ABC transporter permease [Anaerolineales bacterium]
MMTKRENWIPYTFLAPALLILLAFRLWPIVIGLSESLFSVSFLNAGARIFVGFENYLRLLTDRVFLQSLQVSLAFNLIVNPLQVLLALGLAFLVNQRVPGVGAFRSLYLIPIAISINVSALIWKLVLDENGLLNGLIRTGGGSPIPFLTSTEWALGSIIGIASWIGVPFWTLFLLAGLQGISPQIYEAAAIDGAGGVSRLRFITLPLLRRSIGFVLIADTISNFLLFAPVLLLTEGGPQLSTNLVMFEAYRRGLVYGDFGMAAIVSLQLILIVSIVLAQFYLFRER